MKTRTFLLCIWPILMIAMLIAVAWAQTPAADKLAAPAAKTSAVVKATELELTQLQLIQEKRARNADQATIMRQAFSQNQAAAQQLAKQETELRAKICEAHGMKSDCAIDPSGSLKAH